ncbi:MAG: PAS domain-containing protein, partial [Fibrobacter sp.]|nr:PAS domain-containing protein [Fibrobacter sp.]
MNLLFAAGFVNVAAIASLLVLYSKLRKKVKRLKQIHTYAERDITYSDQIIVSKRELETVFDSISEQICIIDKNYRIVRVNKNYSSAVGMPIRGILNRYCYQIFRDRNKICDNCPARETFRTANVAVRKTMSNREGEDVRHYELQAFPVFDEQGEIIRVIERIRDITEEKRFFEQLVRSEKLASIGIMTSGVAHEINNPLSGISGIAVNMLQMPEKYGINEKAASRISMIADLASRATSIMNDLLHLSRKHDKTNIKVNINTLLVKTINAIHLEGISETEYQYNLESTLQLIDCDPSKIQQVIVNVATNSLQAIQEEKCRCDSLGKEYKGLL